MEKGGLQESHVHFQKEEAHVASALGVTRILFPFFEGRSAIVFTRSRFVEVHKRAQTEQVGLVLAPSRAGVVHNEDHVHARRVQDLVQVFEARSGHVTCGQVPRAQNRLVWVDQLEHFVSVTFGGKSVHKNLTNSFGTSQKFVNMRSEFDDEVELVSVPRLQSEHFVPFALFFQCFQIRF